MPIWQKDYFRLINFKKQELLKNLWKPNRNAILWSRFTFIKDISICKDVSFCGQGYGGQLNIKNDLTWLNDLTKYQKDLWNGPGY